MSIKINDPRTIVTEVYTKKARWPERPDDEEIWYKMKDHGEPWVLGTGHHYAKPGSLKLKSADVIAYINPVNGDEYTAVIGTDMMYDSGAGFTSKKLEGNNEDKDKKEKKESKKKSDDDKDDEGFCDKLLFTIIPILPLWWIIKAICNVFLWPFRCVFCSDCDYPWPSYSLKKW